MRTLIVTAVVLVMLGGCSPDAEPSPPPTPTGPVTTSPTPADTVTSTGPTPTSATTTSATTTEPPDSTTETSSPEATGAPTLPPEATEDTEAGAEAFALYYIETLNEAYLDPSGSDLLSLQTVDCETCESINLDLDELARDGLRYSEAPFIVIDSFGTSLGTTQAVFTVELDAQPISVVDSDGVTRTAYEPPSPLLAQLTLSMQDHWMVESLVIGPAQ